ncbi:MAG: glycosyltransferase [Bacteroidetes bacterium]|nr:glycosyltransferase [Bacteroidota bacterium]
MISELDIVLPLYNPQAGWSETVLVRYNEFRNRLPQVSCRLIIVNDGSEQGINQQQIEALQNKIPELTYVGYQTNRGKGHALRQGVEVASADNCMVTDIDFPFTSTSMLSICEALEENTVVIGVRDSSYFKALPLRRKVLSAVVERLVGLLFQLQVTDTQCGLKAFGRPGKKIFLSGEVDGYIHDVEFIRNAGSNRDISIKKVPVTLREGITFSSMAPKALMIEFWNLLKILF